MVSLCELARPSVGVVTRVAAVEAQRPWAHQVMNALRPLLLGQR